MLSNTGQSAKFSAEFGCLIPILYTFFDQKNDSEKVVLQQEKEV